MFTDATRAMAVGSGEKDNKKALAQRKKQVKTIHTYRYKICVFEVHKTGYMYIIQI